MAPLAKEGFGSMKILRIVFRGALLLFLSSLYFPYDLALAQTRQTQLPQPSSQFEAIKKDFSRLSAEEKLR